jgi:hypothetical protein
MIRVNREVVCDLANELENEYVRHLLCRYHAVIMPLFHTLAICQALATIWCVLVCGDVWCVGPSRRAVPSFTAVDLF